MNEYLKPNHPQLETVVDILDRRAGWFYENSNLEGFTQPAFKVIQLEDGSYETINLLTPEQLKKNQEIHQKQEDYRDSDFKYILDLIYQQHNNWFL
jgi:hypothetical protein